MCSLLGDILRLLAWMAAFVPSTQPEQPKGERKGASWIIESESQVQWLSTVWTFLNLFGPWFTHKCNITYCLSYNDHALYILFKYLLNNFVFTVTLFGRYDYTHFSGRETEVERGEYLAYTNTGRKGWSQVLKATSLAPKAMFILNTFCCLLVQSTLLLLWRLISFTSSKSWSTLCHIIRGAQYTLMIILISPPLFLFSCPGDPKCVPGNQD